MRNATRSIRTSAEKMCGLERGFSLIELMVAMVIGLIILLVIGGLFLNSRQTYLAQDANSRLQENGRYITELFGRQIRSAGYFSINFNPLSSANLFATPASFKFAGSAVQGVGTNSITLSLNATKDCLGQATTMPVNLFRVNASSQLECVAAGNTGVILDDVESMLVLYRQQGETVYKTAGAVSMDKVSSVRICVLLRAKADKNQKAIDSGQNQSYTDCIGATLSSADGYVRRAITTTVALRNRMP